MFRSKNKIALLLSENADDSLGRSLAKEGFRPEGGGQVQSDLERVVENIVNSALGLHIETSCLNGIVSVFKKGTCYFNGRIGVEHW
jgi:RNA 3'-terminal phosphate cyclase